MSDLGNNSTTAAMRLAEKSIEALMKLFKFLLERKEKKMSAELKKEQLNEMKLKSGERIAKLKIDGKVGFVKAKLLQRTGDPLVAIKTTMTDQQVKNFSQLAKKYGILFTSISDKSKSGEREHTFFVREKDLATAKEITDRMTKAIQLKAIEEKISEINGKINLSERDIADIDYLKQKEEDIIYVDTKAFNDENAEIIFNDVCGEMQNKSLSFDKALNRYTDRDFSRDTPYFLCERTNPTSYIELESKVAEYAGCEYTRTDYKVYNNQIEQTADLTLRKDGKFTDERFDGRVKDFWQNIKSDMKKKGSFSDDILVFNSKKEFLRYQQLFKEHQKEISIVEREGEYRDYTAITEQLKVQLDKKNVELDKSGNAVDKVTKKPLTMAGVKSIEERSRIAESEVIAMQIKNYKELSKSQVKLEMDKQQIESMEQETKGYAELIAEKSVTEEYIKEMLIKEEFLKNERDQINGIQVATEVNKEYRNKHKEHEAAEASERNEHDERKELDHDTHTLNEWKAQMAEMSEQTIKNSSVADKVIEKTVPSKGDR